MVEGQGDGRRGNYVYFAGGAGVTDLSWAKITAWVQATLPAYGGVGIFLSAFLDSSFLPLPLVTDLMVMELSSRNPSRMPYYAAMAATGSLIGCIWIYLLARKGGQAYYRRKQGQAPGRIHQWVEKYPLTSVLLPAVAPFPVPFKPFVIAQGVFQVPFLRSWSELFLGGGCCFLLKGFLARGMGKLQRNSYYAKNGHPWGYSLG